MSTTALINRRQQIRRVPSNRRERPRYRTRRAALAWADDFVRRIEVDDLLLAVAASPRGASMTESRRIIYTAKAHVTGGRTEGHGRASDGALEVDLRTPVEMGGAGGGTNPEQLFAIGYAACFESAMDVAARRRRQEIADIAIDSKVMLLPTADRGFKLAVALAVTLPSVHDPHQAVELVRAAHCVCPYSNATRGNVDVSLTANGVAVDDVSKPLAA
jgi:lipoyl-dependent peroxiredoxin